MIRRAALAVAWLAACVGPPPAATPADPVRDRPGADGGASSVADAANAANAAPDPLTVREGDRAIEFACNGLDDDEDGLVDLLLPSAANACHTDRPGACGAGHAACVDGRRVCMTPPPMPEVEDGVDNDCNGAVDDVRVEAQHPRALVLAPRYAWTDAAPDIANVMATLAQAGIPYERQAVGTEWDAAIATLDGYSIAVVPGYLLGTAISASARAGLERFVTRGGVLVIWKPIGKPEQKQAWDLAGLTGSARRRDVAELRVEGTSPFTADLDRPEERTLPINGKPGPNGVEVWVLEPREGTEIVLRAYAGGKAVGAAATRRALGKGAVYALGHDLSTFDAPRCYVNCFEPSGDVMRMALEGVYREGAAGHVVLSHTVPGAASSVLLVTHDLDAPDAQNAGEWGEPGALQAAHVERGHGARATFNVTTDYVAGYFNPVVVKQLCALGMCPLGAHGVVYSARFAALPEGTCTETRATYGSAPSLCGEVRVSMQLLAELTGERPRVWRSPFLALHPKQYDVLAKAGVLYDSGFGIGDLPHNLPLDLAAIGAHQDRFHQRSLLEFPIALEDGLDTVEQGKHRRVELQESNKNLFAARWDYTLLANAQNRAMTTLVLHPSRGRDMPNDNMRVKMVALDRILSRATSADAVALTMDQMGDFWRARLAARVDATWDGSSYKGTITAGPTTAPGFTLEFGDAIVGFSCPECGGEAQIHGKRVVLPTALKPGVRATFTARTR